MEENNNNKDKTLLDKGKEFVKKETKRAGKNLAKKAIKLAWPIISIFLLILLAIGFLNLIPWSIQSWFSSIFSSSDLADSTSSTELSITNLVYIDENTGEYKLNIENFSNQILEKLENQKVNNELLGLTTEEEIDTEELKDLIDEYLKAEIKTSLPKIGQSDIDGIITIRRASVDGGVKDLKYKKLSDFERLSGEEKLDYFSLTSEFELCIATEGDYIEYYDHAIDSDDEEPKPDRTSGSQVDVEYIKYQDYTQKYATPFNFLISLHVMAQDKEFMEEVVKKVQDSEIELTYVESQIHEITEVEYTGHEYIEARELDLITEEETGAKKIIKNEDIDNDSVKKHVHDVEEFKKVKVTTTGQIYITKANTWVIKSNKQVAELVGNTQLVGSPKTENVLTEPLSPTIVYQEFLPDLNVFMKYRRYEQKTIDKTTKEFVTTLIYTIIDKECVIKLEEFRDLIRSYPNVENNLASAPSNIFYLLQQNENTQNLEKVMRYVMYLLNEIDYGVEEQDLLDIFGEKEITVDIISSLKSYLGQFSQYPNGAPTYRNKKYYQMYARYDDGSPAIGDADLKWSVYQSWFENKPGYIMDEGEERYVENIAKEVNRLLDKKVDVEDIYIQKSVVDKISDAIQNSIRNKVINNLSGLTMSTQQVYALAAIYDDLGTLPSINGQTFKTVYTEGATKYEEGSWQHNKYIWDNWWCQLPGDERCRDAQFETYLKGIVDCSTSEAGGIYSRSYYIYFTEQQLSKRTNSVKLKVTRSSSNEKDIFSLEVQDGTFERTGGNNIVGYYTSTTGRKFTIFNQNRITGWGGFCNRAASAIVVSGYSIETPEQIIQKLNYAHRTGCTIASNSELWNDYNLTSGAFSYLGRSYVGTLRKQLQSGGYALVWLNNGGIYRGTSGEVWTELYHWVAILDYRVKDGKEQIAVADHRGVDWYGIDEFQHGVSNYVPINEL